jgi:hypothetical protein
MCTLGPLLDHLLGGGQQRFRDGKVERIVGIVMENGLIHTDQRDAGGQAGIMTKSSTTNRVAAQVY